MKINMDCLLTTIHCIAAGLTLKSHINTSLLKQSHINTDQMKIVVLLLLDSLTADDFPVIDDIQDLLVEAGFPHLLSMANKHQVVVSLTLHSVIFSRKAELDQFINGLECLVEWVRKYPSLMRPLLVAGDTAPPTKEDWLNMIVFENEDKELEDFFKEYLEIEGRACLALSLCFMFRIS